MGFERLAPAIAEELAAMATATESLAADLCADETAALRCLPLLQRFDLLAQQQAELAALIARLGEGRPPAEVLAAVRLDELAARLSRAS